MLFSTPPPPLSPLCPPPRLRAHPGLACRRVLTLESIGSRHLGTIQWSARGGGVWWTGIWWNIDLLVFLHNTAFHTITNIGSDRNSLLEITTTVWIKLMQCKYERKPVTMPRKNLWLSLILLALNALQQIFFLASAFPKKTLEELQVKVFSPLRLTTWKSSIENLDDECACMTSGSLFQIGNWEVSFRGWSLPCTWESRAQCELEGSQPGHAIEKDSVDCTKEIWTF